MDHAAVRRRPGAAGAGDRPLGAVLRRPERRCPAHTGRIRRVPVRLDAGVRRGIRHDHRHRLRRRLQRHRHRRLHLGQRRGAAARVERSPSGSTTSSRRSPTPGSPVRSSTSDAVDLCAFALPITVGATFAVGLFLAITFNNARMRGRRIYRSLLILPYAMPVVPVGAGVGQHDRSRELRVPERGHLRRGRDPLADRPVDGQGLGADRQHLARVPEYMFLVCTGALQSIPDELQEAATVDGAKPFQVFRLIKLPLLLVSIAPSQVGVRLQLQQLQRRLHAHRWRAEGFGMRRYPSATPDILI